jgi:DNA-binding NarL/FixJ family response regulator
MAPVKRSHPDIFTDAEWLELKEELSLSPRHAEIIKFLLRGLSDRQIALELGVSFHTVRTYLSRLFVRFNVEDRVGLILAVFRRFHHEDLSRSRGQARQEAS